MDYKKELVIKVLEKLQWYWDLAEDLLVIVKSSYCTDDLLDSLIRLISKSIKTVKKWNERKLMEKSLIQIQKIKEMEEKSKMSEEDLDKLLEGID